MAKSDADDDGGLPPVGDGTLDGLEEAKKGKARYFLLVCKGPKVLYMLVKKKPVKKTEITDAKKLGYKGEGFFGVITGSGMQLVFNLAIADGYEAAPSTDKKLKEFLDEHVGVKCQPQFAIVPTLPEIPNEEDEQPDSATSSMPEPTSDAPAPTADSVLKQKLLDALGKLVPQLKQVITTFPDKRNQLLSSVDKAKKLIESGNLSEGKQAVLDVGQLIKQSLKDSSVDSAPSTGTQGDQLEKYRQYAARLEPGFLAAVKNAPDKASSLRAVWAFAEEQASKGQFEKAQAALERLEQALQNLLQDQSAVDLAAQRVREVIRKATMELRRLQVALQQTNHPTAIQIVDVLENLVEQVQTPPSSLDSARQMLQFVESDKSITSAERPNPFGLTIQIRQPLVDALSELVTQLSV